MLHQLAAIVPEVTDLPGDLRQVRLFRSNSLSSDRSYRSRQQPSAAFRGGQLRAARSRACLGTSCLGGVHHGGCCGLESGLFYFAHASSLRLRSAGAHFVRRAVALALARRASVEYTTRVDQGWKAGCFISLTPAAFSCAPRGRTSCGAQSRLPWHVVPRRNTPRGLISVGERPAEGGQAVRPAKMRSRKAAGVSATNFMASEPSSLWFYVLQDPDAP
jgi:hypothetical protein